MKMKLFTTLVAVLAVSTVSFGALDMGFAPDGLESYGLNVVPGDYNWSDITHWGQPAHPWKGGGYPNTTPGQKAIVTIDPDDIDGSGTSIRANTPTSRFGEVLFEMHSYGPGSQTSNVLQRQFNSTPFLLNDADNYEFSFDYRTRVSADPDNAALSYDHDAEFALGGERSFSLIISDQSGPLKIYFRGAAGKQVAEGTTSLTEYHDTGITLNWGQWYNIKYSYNIANDLYNWVEVDGTRYDNSGAGWDAAVYQYGQLPSNFTNIRWGGNDLDNDGSPDSTYYESDKFLVDNIAVQDGAVIPEPATLTLLGLGGLGVLVRRRRK